MSCNCLCHALLTRSLAVRVLPQPPRDGCDPGPSSATSSPATPSRVECCVCFDGKRDVVLSPCAHCCMCARCAARLMQRPESRKCPMCRAPIVCVVLVDNPAVAPPPTAPTAAPPTGAEAV